MIIIELQSFVPAPSTIPLWGNGHAQSVRRIQPTVARRWRTVDLRHFQVRRMGPETRPRPHRVAKRLRGQPCHAGACAHHERKKQR